MSQQVQRVTPAHQPVLDATHHQWAAILRLQRPNLGQRQPVRGEDTAIELPSGIVRGQPAAEAKAQVSDIARLVPAVVP